MRILITGAGGAAAISVWKSLQHEHTLFMADMDPCAAGLYLVPSEQRLIIPSGKSPAFADTLLNHCKRLQIDALIATVDAELIPLAKEAEQFKQAGTFVPLCTPQVLTTCLDKYQLLLQCQAHVAVPQFMLLTEDSLPTIHRFPQFAKPRTGAGSTGAKYIHSSNDLLTLPLDGSYLVQEVLPGEEFSVDTYTTTTHQVIAAVTRLRMKIDSGIAVASRTLHVPELIDMATTVAKQVGLRYVANIQFKRSEDGQFKLLEINPRFSGTLPLTTAAGVDIPKLLLKELQNEPLPTALIPFIDLMTVRYWAEKFISPAEWEALKQ